MFPALLLIACLPNPVHAALTCQLQSSQVVEGHGTVFITPSDNLPIGAPVSSWSIYRIWFLCQATAGSTRWGALERQVPSFDSGVIWNATGSYPNAKVYTTAELQPLGVGYALNWYVIDDQLGYVGSSLGLQAIDQPALLIGDGYLSRAIAAQDLNKNLNLGIEMSYRLIKISDAFNANIDAGAIPMPNPTTLARFTLTDQTNAVTNPIAYANILSPTFTFAKRTCTTPSWPTIPLPTITPDALPFVGATGPEVEFNLLMNCPTHLGEVGYYFTATNGFYDEAQGIINIDSSSVAQGIAVQVQTRMRPHPVYLSGGGGNPPSSLYGPIQFGPTNRYALRNYTLYGPTNQDPLTHRADFSMSSDGGSDIPMKVSVVRTGNVVPGKFTASLIVVFVYR